MVDKWIVKEINKERIKDCFTLNAYGKRLVNSLRNITIQRKKKICH